MAVLNLKTDLRRRCGLCVLAFVAMTIVGITGTTLKVFAEGSSGTGTGATGGSCTTDKNKTVYWDTCYGATWRRYPAESDSITIKDAGNVKGGTIKNCKTNGGYYYRLALEAYSPKVFYSSGVVAASLGYQAGLVRVNQIRNLGSGFYNFIDGSVGIPGTEKWDTVKDHFYAALEAGITGFSTDWDTTAWFCWDLNLENPQMQFQSKSRASSGGDTNVSLSWDSDAPDLEVQADEDGKATVIFAHQLRYEAGKVTGTYENASTKWTIKTDLLDRTETDTWSTPGVESKETDWFTTGDKVLKVEVQLGEEETEKRVCSTISYQTKTVKWDNSTPHKMLPVNDTGTTKACAVIKKTETPKQNTGGIVFWPQSSVESVADRDVVNHKEWTTDDKNKADGDIVSMQLSTDYDQAKANFEHKIHAEVDLGGYTFGRNDEWDTTNMCTEYWVNYADGTTSSKEKFCAPKPGSGSSTASDEKSVPGKQGFVINVEGKAIEKINYEPKTIPVKRVEKKDGPCNTVPETNTCSWNPARYKYYADANSGSGSGNSSAEIEYVSPNEPNNSDGPSSGNRNNGNPMYAGESTTMTWWAEAEAINTRRIAEYQSVAFEVLWSAGYNEEALSGDLDKNLKYSDSPGRSRYDPCEYWRRRLPLQTLVSPNCTTVSPGDILLNDTFSTNGLTGFHRIDNETRSMVVPDYVGDKYCNSFAYKWQYYWGVKRKSSGNQWVWTPENQTYWTHYDAACRTIAKKPSLSAWNGGVFANGGISTSLASRYENTTVGTLVSGSANASYGSWTEHLGVANGGILNFGTGGSLAFGSNSIGVSINSNSPLTIRNDIALGSAGIAKNPTLVSRLSDYLSDIPETEYHSEGEVNIYSSIVSNGGADDIYSLPQKIIYAPNASKVNIYSGATQIDAWIIAPNAVINTCADFTSSNGNPGGTETRPADSHPCDAPLRVNGPVIASSLKLNRTGGADITNDGDNYTAVLGPTYINDWQKYTPAEVFNLSADTYLWAYAQAGRYGSSYTEAYSRELPPRY